MRKKEKELVAGDKPEKLSIKEKRQIKKQKSYHNIDIGYGIVDLIFDILDVILDII